MRFSRTALRACIGAAAAWTVVLLLGGCGAGVVGTGSGTDENGLGDIIYTPLPVCEADFAARHLACGADGASFDVGTAAVQWADANKSNGGASVLARVAVQTLRLQLACNELRFEGNWGELPDGTRAFVGRYTPLGESKALPAMLNVLPAPNEPDAVGWLQLSDPTGSALAGPWLVRRVDGSVEFGACAS